MIVCTMWALGEAKENKLLVSHQPISKKNYQGTFFYYLFIVCCNLFSKSKCLTVFNG